MLKKIAVLAAAAAVSVPAFADHGRGHARGHYRPVVHHYYHYRPAPRPVVVYHRPAPVYYQPAPVYHYHSSVNPGALLVGAVLGAAIVHTVVSAH